MEHFRFYFKEFDKVVDDKVPVDALSHAVERWRIRGTTRASPYFRISDDVTGRMNDAAVSQRICQSSNQDRGDVLPVEQYGRHKQNVSRVLLHKW